MSDSPQKIFELSGVPDAEADDVRRLLDRNRIRWYETPRANFGVSVAAIWVKREEDYAKAQKLLHRYQAERARRGRTMPPRSASAGSSKRTQAAFLAFIAILLIWMYFVGVWRP